MAAAIKLIERAKAMTVQDLIDSLEDVRDKSAPVFMQSNYGDHCGTQQLLPVDTVEQTTELGVDETAYSGSGLARQVIEGRDDVGDFDVVVLL